MCVYSYINRLKIKSSIKCKTKELIKYQTIKVIIFKFVQLFISLRFHWLSSLHGMWRHILQQLFDIWAFLPVNRGASVCLIGIRIRGIFGQCLQSVFLLVVHIWGMRLESASLSLPVLCHIGSRVCLPVVASSVCGDPFLWPGCVHSACILS